MKKPTLLVTIVDFDHKDSNALAFLDNTYGAFGYALFQGADGVNQKISLIKLIRKLSGVDLRRGNDAASAIVETIKSLPKIDAVKEELSDRIAKLDGHQMKMLLDHINRSDAYCESKDPDIVRITN